MTKPVKQRIIIFTRYPEIGNCKTRLIPILGKLNATELHKRMTRNIISTAGQYCEIDTSCSLEIRFSGASIEEMTNCYGPHFFRKQSEGNLGNKMLQALGQAVSEGMEKVVLVGSDCVDISVKLLDRAFKQLTTNDLLLGPAFDGGYYLIGMKQCIADLFPDDMPWGTDTVLKRTLQITHNLKLTYAVLKKLADTDVPEDLIRLSQTVFLENLPEPIISVIIPALNEEAIIADTLASLESDHLEVIVCDGGSKDSTREIANKYAATLIDSEKGRGNQQNLGAKKARGTILLFLHADTILPENFFDEIVRILSTPGVSAGAFKIRLSGSNRALKFIPYLINLRSVLFQKPYGDQGIFLKKEIFYQMGCFPQIPIMEDYALILKLKKIGRILISDKSVLSSGRRWDKNGFIRTSLINQLIIIGFHLNVKIDKLETFYRRF